MILSPRKKPPQHLFLLTNNKHNAAAAVVAGINPKDEASNLPDLDGYQISREQNYYYSVVAKLQHGHSTAFSLTISTSTELTLFGTEYQ